MKILLAGVLVVSALSPARAQGDLFQLTDDVNVQWKSPQEVVQGLGRKFYTGETLHVTVTGQFVQNNERTERHCKVFDWFCDDVRVPAPQTLAPATYPLAIVLMSDKGNTPHPLMPNQIFVLAGGFDLVIPDDTPDGFRKAWRIRAMIPEGTNFNRSICVGTYTIHISVDNTRRLTAFQSYLGAGARTADDVRDVLDERLTTHYGPQVADALALHAQARFADNPNPALKAEYPRLLEFALGLDSGSSAIPRKLAEYYISTGNFPQAQANALNQAKNAKDDADRGRAYLLLGQVKEGERTQFAEGAVRAAAALYEQAADLGRSAQHRTLLLDALNRDGRALRRIRTRMTLSRAAELFERAKDAAPANLEGLVADINADRKLLLTTKVRFGFALESNLTLTSSGFVGAAQDDWLPVAADPSGNVLVSRSSGDVELWNSQRIGTQHLGIATVSEAATGGGSAMVVATNGDVILMTPARPQRVVVKSASRISTPGVPPDPNIPFLSFFGMATNAEVIYWYSPSNGIHIQNFQGDELRTITAGPNEFILQGALSANGSVFAAVVAIAPVPGQVAQSVVVRIWNVQDSAAFKVAKNAQGANLSANAWWIRKNAISFSPDGKRVYWNVDKQLHAIRVPEYTLEGSLDVGAALPQGAPMGVGGGAVPVPLISHMWVDADRVAVYATFDPAIMVPEKPIVLVKHSMLTASPGAARPTYMFLGQPGTIPPLSGPFFQSGSKEGEVLALRAVQKHQATVYSLVDGVEHGRRDFEPAESNYLAIADEGHTIAEMDRSGTTLYGLSSSEAVRRNTVFNGPLEDLGHGEWQAAEQQPATGRFVALHRFQGRVEIGAANLPPVDSTADIVGPGKLCAVPAGPFTAPFAWTPFVNRISQQGVRFVPSSFLVVPPANYPHNMMDVPMISMSSALPPAKEIRRLMSCARLVALATGSKAVLQMVELGFGLPQRLVFAPGEGTANPIDVLPAIAPTSGQFPWPPTLEARFLPDGKSFGVAVMRPNQGPQVSFWTYTGSGLVQQPCAACGRPNLSSSEAVQSAYPNYAAPLVIFSVSGKKVLLVAGDRLLVHDFSTNSIQLQMDIEVPVALTDEVLVTVGKNRDLHLWKY
jgi:tetratricopeptide (TPR) repeat protein